MFRLAPNPTFRATVRVTVPGAEPMPIEFEFRHKTRTGLAEWLKGVSKKSDMELAREFVVGWSNVINEAGDQEPFSYDALQNLFENFHAASVEVYAGYLKALTESRAKN